MKIIWLGIVFGAILLPVSFAYNNIEVDLRNNDIKITDFCFGDLAVKGDFSFDFKKEDGALIFNLEGKNISLENINLPWIKAQLVKRGDIIFVNYISSPDFTVKGNIDLAKDEVALNVDIKSWKESPSLKGVIDAKAKVWGKFNDLIVSGSLTIKNGEYRNHAFSHLFLNFLGKPPLFNLTDSKCIFKDGNIYKIEGLLNLSDFSNIFPEAKFISQRIALAGWELVFDENKNVGVKKDVDNKFDVVFDTYNKDDNLTEQGAELRYKLKRDEFLKLRMQEDKTIVGFERRKEF